MKYKWGPIKVLWEFYDTNSTVFPVEIRFTEPNPRTVRVWFYHGEDYLKACQYVEAMLKLWPEELYKEGQRGDSVSLRDYCFSVIGQATELMSGESQHKRFGTFRTGS